jgi:UDP-2,4-diacetamido-2,4,6-trideoxy-beta-L-altropyranose hydrolase
MCSDTLIIRADASPVMGTGHVMRCLALAQAWQDGADLEGANCIFAMVEPMPSLEQRLRSEGFEVVALSALPGSMEDAAQLTELARKRDARWIVVDGYQFATEYHRTLKGAGRRVLVVDDHGHTGAYFADLVLNQNLGAKEGFYDRREPDTKLLLGPRYAMLRREFKPWREWKREIAPVATNFLVTMGGSDPGNVTERVMQALSSCRIPRMEVTIVVGNGNPRMKSLASAADQSDGRFRLLKDVNNMPELMAQADIGVIAGGGTLWELLFMGCPVASFARNALQTRIMADYGKGAVQFMGPARDFDREHLASAISLLASSASCRREMSALGRATIDGRGAERVCEQMIRGDFIEPKFEDGAGVGARS